MNFFLILIHEETFIPGPTERHASRWYPRAGLHMKLWTACGLLSGEDFPTNGEIFFYLLNGIDFFLFWSWYLLCSVSKFYYWFIFFFVNCGADYSSCFASAMDSNFPLQCWLAEDSNCCLLFRFYPQPQPFPSHPRTQPQPCILHTRLQPLVRNLCQPAHWCPYVCHLPKVPFGTSSLPRCWWCWHGHPQPHRSPYGHQHNHQIHMGYLATILLCVPPSFSQPQAPWAMGIHQPDHPASSWCCHGLLLGMEVSCLSHSLDVCGRRNASNGWPFHLWTLCFSPRSGNIFILRPAKSPDMECRVPQWTPWFSEDLGEQALQGEGDGAWILQWFRVIQVVEPGNLHVYHGSNGGSVQPDEAEGNKKWCYQESWLVNFFMYFISCTLQFSLVTIVVLYYLGTTGWRLWLWKASLVFLISHLILIRCGRLIYKCHWILLPCILLYLSSYNALTFLDVFF